ncbi:MAG: hypothetical protein Q9191_006898 [Dirinaria sp. TL-2023a]
MADSGRSQEQQHPNLHLTPEERRYFGQLFSAADTDKIGVITGEIAVKFFEKTRLPPTALGEVRNCVMTVEKERADTADHADMADSRHGESRASHACWFWHGTPVDRFDGIPGPSTPNSPPSSFAGPVRPQHSGGPGSGPIRVPPLTADKVNSYTSLFEESGVQNGMLSGESAKSIFERAQLPNEVLGRIWNLADTEQRGSLGLTEFIIAMHLLASYKNGSMRALPQILPAGLYEAAARRGISRQNTGTRPGPETASSVPRQFSGSNFQRVSSPLAGLPQGPSPNPSISTGDQWAISPQDKAQFDQIFATVDTSNRGFITGDQAVTFFSNSRLPEEALAQIWDLADIKSEGQLNRDEFAVAMYLIRQQRSKRDGRDVLPQSLPQNLIPPSMRLQGQAPSQPTAPAFDNAANATAPKKASDDLFGLDALSSPSAPPLAPKSTGDSSTYTPTSSRAQDSPQFQQSSQPQQQQSSVFKPFVPSSSFGQTIMQPQSTGSDRGSPVPSQRVQPQSKQPSAMEDLLGDNDPEVSQKLTQETTDLANLSNQVSTLSGQMQQVTTNRGSNDQRVSQLQAQKRDFENRLAQLRTTYEQEVRDFRAGENLLAELGNDISKIQQEIATLESAHQDVRNRRVQNEETIAQEQEHKATLTEKLRQMNADLAQWKPELEKMESDLRHQKGLNAISRKQLATLEAERDRLKGEYEQLSRENDEAKREFEQTKRSLDAQAVQPTPAAVTSPGASMNPFFRQRALTGSSDKGVSSPFTPQNAAVPNHDAFDSFFGPVAEPASQSSGVPATSFGTSPPTQQREMPEEPTFTGQVVKSPKGSEVPMSVETPSPPIIDTPQSTTVPPAPPQSRQITSSFLPLRSDLDRPESRSSSVRVAPPASRMSGSSSYSTPTDRGAPFSAPIDPRVDAPKPAEENASPVTHMSQSSSEAAAQTPPSGVMDPRVGQTDQGTTGLPSNQREESRDIPGAFPGDATPPVQTQQRASESSDEPFHPTDSQPQSASNAKNDPFSMASEKQRTPPSAKDDFDAAFASFGNTGKAVEPGQTGIGNGQLHNPATEFPPIQEFGADDDSDSDSDRGFDDNFTAASPPRPPGIGSTNTLHPTVPGLETGSSSSALARPPFTSTETNTSQLPTPGAQTSPPTYDQITPPPTSTGGQRSGSNQFPAEYSGLLPSREDQTSAVASPPVKSPVSTTVTSPTSGSGEPSSSFFGEGTRAEPQSIGPTFGDILSKHQSPMAPGASAAPFAYSQPPSQAASRSASQSQPPGPIQSETQAPPPAVPAKTAFDDFDDEFNDLSEAKEADDKTEDDLNTSHREGFEEFNPTFDSPATTKSTIQPPSNTLRDTSFHDFESSITGGQGYGPRQVTGQIQPASQSHDWDAIFAGLDTPQNNGVAPSPPAQKQAFEAPPGPPPSQTQARGLTPSKPSLHRGLSEDTEHDDPILKRLTGMGYSRDAAVKALEKYDYNIDKV